MKLEGSPMKHLLDYTDELKELKKIALFLDYDGTLVSFKPRPEDAVPTPDVIALLERLVKNPKFRVIIVSGRSIKELQRLLPVQGLGLIGLHGIQIKYVGNRHAYSLPWIWEKAERIRPVLQRIKSKLTDEFKNENIFIEDKEFTLAFHYRQLEECKVKNVREKFFELVGADSICDYGVPRQRWSCKRENIEIIDGAKVLEIRLKGWNKGDAVKKVIKEIEDAAPVYIGDDATDEDAFAVINSKKDGIAAVVLNNTGRGEPSLAPSLRPTHAKFWLKNSNEVTKFLNNLL